MAVEVQRVRYFTGEFLQAGDFNAEQAYHIRMRYLHNRWMHTWGIVNGLDVSEGPEPLEVTVEEGMALVRMIEPSILEFKGEDVAKELVLTDEEIVKLPGVVTGGSQYFIVASYEEEAEQPVGTGETRWVERPAIRAVLASSEPPPDNETTLILARVEVDSGGTRIAAIDSQERRMAGVRGEVDATRLRLPVSGVLDPAKWPTLRGGAANRLDVSGSLNIANGNLDLSGSLNVTNGNVTLPAGAKVDGRDVSADGDILDTHLDDMLLHVTNGNGHDHASGNGARIPWAALKDVPDLLIKAYASVVCTQVDLDVVRKSNVFSVERSGDAGAFVVTYAEPDTAGDPMTFVTVEAPEPLMVFVTASTSESSTLNVVRPTGALVDPTRLHVLVI